MQELKRNGINIKTNYNSVIGRILNLSGDKGKGLTIQILNKAYIFGRRCIDDTTLSNITKVSLNNGRNLFSRL